MNKKILQIIVPIAMVGVVACIWYTQDQTEKASIAKQESIVYESPDFSLHTSNVDLEKLTIHNLPIIIDFGADECAPCKAMAPVLDKVNADMQGKAIIKFVDVWKYPKGAYGFPIQVIPTQLIFNADGTPYVPSEDVAAILKFDNYANKTTKDHMYTVHVGGLTEEQMRAILSDMGVS
ncbi:thioredoxin family protein [Candidatus Epulonipiscium viviparus]|uniref:thioredoxin family protein n=1 Tax=Candidatus Epulonipiscium viviparus TaxID=420336 RepID=UPI0027380A05|nr:thioredoxin family protein [Candidatus Epulopiscium viviparus]